MSDVFSSIPKLELLHMLVHNTPVAYIILDDDYRIHFINDNFLQLRGLTAENTMGRRCYDISNGGERCRHCAVEKALEEGQKAVVSRKDVMPNGQVRYIDDYAFPLYTDENGKNYILEIMVNRTQEMLALQQRDDKYHEVLTVLTSLIDAKDTYTATHSSNVRAVATRLAGAMGLGDRDIFEISVAGTLHDIGKVRVPVEIITKPSRLTEEEYEVMKRHPAYSYDMLQGFESMEGIRRAVRHHHERYDGAGYPDRLAGEEIPLSARIIAVADTYDAIVSTRSYRKGRSHQQALEEIDRVAGSQLDPFIVDAFLNMDFESDDASPNKTRPVERTIPQPQGGQGQDKRVEDFEEDIKTEVILPKILECTPCGYAILDKDHTVLYASDYFLTYMGVPRSEAIGRKCYEAMDAGGEPCKPCAMHEAAQEGVVKNARKTLKTKNGTRTFDMFAIPVKGADGEIEYMIETIIDRTAEATLERQRQVDFTKLIRTLSHLMEEENAMAGVKMTEEVKALRRRLTELQKDYEEA